MRRTTSALLYLVFLSSTPDTGDATSPVHLQLGRVMGLAITTKIQAGALLVTSEASMPSLCFLFHSAANMAIQW